MRSGHVGARLRQLRLDAGMPVRTLATQAGVSPSLISQVEHRQVMPSIGSLERLALALGVSLGVFFTALDPSTVRVVRANAREKLTSTWSPVTIEALAPLNGPGLWEPVMLTMAPGGCSGHYPVVPEGETFAFMCVGEVTLTLGDEVYGLQQGDAITFLPAPASQWDNPGAVLAQVLCITRRSVP